MKKKIIMYVEILKVYLKSTFIKKEIYIFRYQQGQKIKDRYCKTLEEAKSLKFRKLMNEPNTNCWVLKGYNEPNYLRLMKANIHLPRITHKYSLCRKPIPVYLIVLISVAAFFASRFIRPLV